MKDKLKKHIKTTYETTDGEVWDTRKKATDWQKILDQIDNVVMLDSSFNRVDDPYSTIFVKVETLEQQLAYNALCKRYGISDNNDLLHSTGYFMYDTDRFINIDIQINELLDIKKQLDANS